MRPKVVYAISKGKKAHLVCTYGDDNHALHTLCGRPTGEEVSVERGERETCKACLAAIRFKGDLRRQYVRYLVDGLYQDKEFGRNGYFGRAIVRLLEEMEFADAGWDAYHKATKKANG